MIITTIKHTYQCESCGKNYIEQRRQEELNAYFTQCDSCGGNYIEISTEEFTHEEPDSIVEG